MPGTRTAAKSTAMAKNFGKAFAIGTGFNVGFVAIER